MTDYVPLSYANCNVFLLCFSIANRRSLQNVETKWKPEIQRFQPNIPIILVGTKLDLRDNPSVIEKFEKMGDPLVTYSEGLEMANKIGAVAYVECSATTRKGIKTIFREVTRHAHTTPPEPKKNDLCNIM